MQGNHDRSGSREPCPRHLSTSRPLKNLSIMGGRWVRYCIAKKENEFAGWRPDHPISLRGLRSLEPLRNGIRLVRSFVTPQIPGAIAARPIPTTRN